jgi:hypothetical protein
MKEEDRFIFKVVKAKKRKPLLAVGAGGQNSPKLGAITKETKLFDVKKH